MAATAIAAIGILALANLVCWVFNENSWAHAKLHLPKLFLNTNRPPKRFSQTTASPPESYWAFDSINLDMAATSLWTESASLIVLRGAMVFYFLLTLLIESQRGDGFGAPGAFITFFTNWTFVLFGLTGCLGLLLSLLYTVSESRLAPHERAALEKGGPLGGLPGGVPEDPSEIWQGQNASLAGRKWPTLAQSFILCVVVASTSSLFLTAFFWIFLYDGKGDIVMDILKHGLNNLFFLAEIVIGRVPFLSYHFQACVLYGTTYLVFMWIYHGSTGIWAYQILNWNKPSSLILYLLLVPLVLLAFAFWFGVAALREWTGHKYSGSSENLPYSRTSRDGEERGLELEAITVQ